MTNSWPQIVFKYLIVFAAGIALAVVIATGDDVVAFFLVAALILIGFGITPACNSVAASLLISGFMAKLFPSLNEWRWIGLLVGFFVSVVLQLPLLILCSAHFLFAVLLLAAGITSIVYLIKRRRRIKRQGNAKTRYLLSILLATILWAGIIGTTIVVLTLYVFKSFG
jgi:hypothetical protein